VTGNRATQPVQIAGFSVSAKWTVLQHMEEVVPQPFNTFAAHAPTVPAADAAFVPTILLRNSKEKSSLE
jgi:hypothetical protein